MAINDNSRSRLPELRGLGLLSGRGSQTPQEKDQQGPGKSLALTKALESPSVCSDIHSEQGWRWMGDRSLVNVRDIFFNESKMN